MSKAQLPLLTSVIMVTQALIAAPAGIRAKRSIKDRNQVLLIGYAAMIAADLTFAFMPTVYGEQRNFAIVQLYLQKWAGGGPFQASLGASTSAC